jgi:hypothetical protein
MNYQEIKNQQPILRNCFFAFSKEQFNEGIAKHNLEGQKIFKAPGGLYGTNEGIMELMNFYQGLNDRIGKECNPQEVYDYEYDNHECGYVGDDTEAMKIAIGYFTTEQCLTIKRRHHFNSIADLTVVMEEEVETAYKNEVG